MSKIYNQIIFIDVSSASHKTIETWDCIENIGKFPIPHIGEYVNFYTKIGDDKYACVDYKVTEIKYSYKKFNRNLLVNESTVVYITIYIKKL